MHHCPQPQALRQLSRCPALLLSPSAASSQDASSLSRYSWTNGFMSLGAWIKLVSTCATDVEVARRAHGHLHPQPQALRQLSRCPALLHFPSAGSSRDAPSRSRYSCGPVESSHSVHESNESARVPQGLSWLGERTAVRTRSRRL